MPMLSEAIAEYLATVSQEEQANQQQELLRFARWLGADRPSEALTMQVVEAYHDYLLANRMDHGRALPPLKAFLAYAERSGVVTQKLARHVKAPRVTRSAGAKRERTAAAGSQQQAAVLTRDGYEALDAELNRLVDVERHNIAQALLEARADRDIRENAPYEAAKQHQAVVEARIRELQTILATAEVLDGAPTGERVAIGSRIVVRDLADNEELRYTLVGSNEANPSKGRLSVASPVGKALLDRVPGDVIEVAAPAGALRYRVERIESA